MTKRKHKKALKKMIERLRPILFDEELDALSIVFHKRKWHWGIYK